MTRVRRWLTATATAGVLLAGCTSPAPAPAPSPTPPPTVGGNGGVAVDSTAELTSLIGAADANEAGVWAADTIRRILAGGRSVTAMCDVDAYDQLTDDAFAWLYLRFDDAGDAKLDRVVGGLATDSATVDSIRLLAWPCANQWDGGLTVRAPVLTDPVIFGPVVMDTADLTDGTTGQAAAAAATVEQDMLFTNEHGEPVKVTVVRDLRLVLVRANPDLSWAVHDWSGAYDVTEPVDDPQ